MPHGPPASEREFLELIDRHFPGVNAHVPLTRGDDCAVLACPEALALSTDLFLEDVHFRRSYFTPGDIGWKSLAVNISDIAGMGCRPLGFSLGLMVPADAGLDGDFWNSLFAGMAALAGEHSLPLVGGDLSRAPMLGLSVTIWGQPGPQGRFLKRGQCRPGDVLLACGQLGLVRTGLLALEAHGPDAAQNWPAAVAAHLRPHPQVGAGLALGALPAVQGAMDVSDGLAMDLPRFLGDGLGADLVLPHRTLHPETLAWCADTGQDPALFTYLGGEDYALLAACHAGAEAAVCAAVPGARVIGQVLAEPRFTINTVPAPPAGFDHFAA